MNSPNSQGNDVWVCDCAVCVARRLDEKKLTERTDAPSLRRYLIQFLEGYEGTSLRLTNSERDCILDALRSKTDAEFDAAIERAAIERTGPHSGEGEA